MLQADGVHRIVLVTGAMHMWRSVHEFTAAGIELVPAPMGMVEARDTGISRFIPNTESLMRGSTAINELLGEQVRLFLAGTHLRRH
jgi:uncharacterized SAM-binding protein YcdF (DUF218 family)